MKNEALEILRELVGQFQKDNPGHAGAPGHSHEEPGFWDNTGQLCDWCALWKRAEALVNQERVNTAQGDSIA